MLHHEFGKFFLPAKKPIKIGIKYFIPTATIPDKVVLGVQPVGIKKEVNKPHAIKIPIIGIIIEDKNPPKFWIFTFIFKASCL